MKTTIVLTLLFALIVAGAVVMEYRDAASAFDGAVATGELE